jgi:hypothetical protein
LVDLSEVSPAQGGPAIEPPMPGLSFSYGLQAVFSRESKVARGGLPVENAAT